MIRVFTSISHIRGDLVFTKLKVIRASNFRIFLQRPNSSYNLFYATYNTHTKHIDIMNCTVVINVLQWCNSKETKSLFSFWKFLGLLLSGNRKFILQRVCCELTMWNLEL